MGYNINDKIRLYGNIGKSYRIPTFYDQYYSSPVEEGNPNLKPEEAITYEVGLRYLNNGISLEGNYFVRDASQLIDWVYSPIDSIWRSQNFQSVTSKGVEIALNFNLNEIFNPNFPIYNVRLSYNYLYQDFNQNENIKSRYALEHIRNQLVFSVEHQIFGKLKNSFNVRYIDRIEQDPYVLLDDRIYYEHNERFTIFLEAANLTDQKYTEVMTPMPDRWFRAGLVFQMGF